jgi:rhamnosyl/mannosyltransferase
VLHLGKYYPPARGGIESHLEVLSNGLNEFVKLRLIVANEGRETITESCNGVHVTRLGELFKLHSAPICPGLISELRRQQPDLVHIHWPNPTAVLAYLISGLRAKLIFTYHSDVVRQRKLAMAFWPLLRLALRQASAIIATSPQYIDSSAILSAHRAKCHVIPFGVRSEYFADTDSLTINRIRTQYGPQILLAVGRLVDYKGFEHLVRAMPWVKGTLLLIGRGPNRAALQKLATDLNVRDRIVFLDEVEDLRPFYQAADIFVFPSIMRSEAFGIVQLEAMACGRPIINTRLDSGVNFVAPDGVSALTVQPGDHLQLAHAINYLFDRPYLGIKLGIGGRRRVRELFTVEGMVRQTLNLYEEVAANGQGVKG